MKGGRDFATVSSRKRSALRCGSLIPTEEEERQEESAVKKKNPLIKNRGIFPRTVKSSRFGKRRHNQVRVRRPASPEKKKKKKRGPRAGGKAELPLSSAKRGEKIPSGGGQANFYPVGILSFIELCSDDID